VAATTTTPAAEPHIFVDPTNSSVLLGAISDFSWRDGYNTTKFTVSGDGGATWTEQFVPTVNVSGFDVLTTSDGYLWDANSDPVVAIDKHGTAYLATLYFDALGASNGFYVAIGSINASGVSFSSILPVSTNPDLFSEFFEDKPWLTVDNSSNPSTTNNVYACWSRFVGNALLGGFTSDYIVFSRSLNGGVSWTLPPQRISPAAHDGAVQGCQVATGPGGEVYVTYELYYVGGKRQHWLAKSTDGGQTFSDPVAITPLFDELSFNSTYRKNSFTSLAVNPVTGYVYVVYADQGASTGAEVEFIRSDTPGGTTFTSPVRLNDSSTGQQFFPAVTSDSDGYIHVMWFDTRNGASSAHYDIYATYSSDGGAAFRENARVTATTIDAADATFIGDYAGVAAAGRSAHPVWTNGGFNNGSMQTATLTVGGAPNTAPIAGDQAVTTNEDTPVAVTFSGSDAEQCDLQFTVVSGPSNGSLSAITGAACTTGSPNTDTATVTYTPNANFNGSDSFTYTVGDGSLTSNATVSITVSPINDAPVAVNTSASTLSGTPVAVTLSATDADGCAPLLSFSVVAPPASGLVSGMTGVTCVSGNHTAQITYTPPQGFTGPDSFTYRANDGFADSNVATVTVTVNAGGVTVTSVQPNVVSQKVGIVDFTITGTGFAAGASVAFENGSGPAPRVNSVTWESSTQLRASVQIRSGGPPRDRFWDVRVTNPGGSTGVGLALLRITP
jgi:hypothetical protein